MTVSKSFIRLASAAAAVFLAACADAEPQQTAALDILESIESTDYCEVAPIPASVLEDRPSASEPVVDDVNWFARPVLHEGSDRIVAFASHDQNYLYNLTDGVRVRIPDRSDAVATPDGRYMTVPSNYTPDRTVRFYPMEPLLAALEAGEDAHETEPAFIHEHESMQGVYYQSTGVLGETEIRDRLVVSYRLMFSGGHDESNFRIVDYLFTHDADGALLDVQASPPMALCGEVKNDLNTPFISKDGRHVAAYTSETPGNQYSPGSSLKIFEITDADPARGTTECREAVDFGFAAGKADFSFDGRALTFHISQGGYLTPFINGGLPSSTITDVVVVELESTDDGAIVGYGGLQRLTTSLTQGVGSYFPAYMPDGSVFYVANEVPRDSDDDKRFRLRVVDPTPDRWRTDAFSAPEAEAAWEKVAGFWTESCGPIESSGENSPWPLDGFEAPWLALSLGAGQCNALLDDASAALAGETDWDALRSVCAAG